MFCPHAPEWGFRDIWRVCHNSAAFCEHGTRLIIHRDRFGILLYCAAVAKARFACAVRRDQIFHHVQAGESILGIKHCIFIFATQIIFYVLPRQGRSPADYGEFQLLPLKILDDILHLER